MKPSPEQELFKAAVLNAFGEACGKVIIGGGRGRYYALHRDKIIRNSRAWLLGNSEDFQVVCTWAGLEPWDVLKAAHRLKNRGWAHFNPSALRKRNEQRTAA